MSSTESPNNSHLLFIGQECHAPHCYLVDFLPFRCEYCTHAFCADHYKPAAHVCEKYDPSKHDRIAPPCPLCNKPVAVPPDQDPNLRMESHIEKECSVTTGNRSTSAAGSMPVCARGKCGKVLFAPIKCNSCNRQFCATHRFSSSHDCAQTSASPQSPPHPATPMAFASAAGTNVINQTSAASAAAIAAIKRSVANVQSKPSAPTSSTTPKAVGGGSASVGGAKHTNPFAKSKTDRRAHAEQESRRRGMRERAKKGLLSEREQILLAEEEAVLAAESKSRKKDSECCVM